MIRDIYDPAAVAALYDSCAPNYRKWSAVASFGLASRWRRQCVDRLMGQRQVARIVKGELGPKPLPGSQVIDLMAGTDEIAPHLLAALPAARITAIENAPAMHASAVAAMEEAHAQAITHLNADALQTGLPDGAADIVVSAFGLKTLNQAQQDRLAGEIARLLRPGGSFALIEVSDPKGWALRPFFWLYLDRILPAAARLFLRDAEGLGQIGHYTRRFGDCSAMGQALKDHGLNVTPGRHFFGCATSLAGTKPIA